ncbi:MAG: hypothetical protein UW70_C0025G0026 [Candidatus Peregrinibacteria bacterium GW2011_GWA2_44_7]|nr:MAG: hypothetical protein UW70_C0025G0026 [Candidatus Peregrinibacteria bacterium GW2011_GWA2_44_7]
MASANSISMDELLKHSPAMVLPMPGELIEGKVIDVSKNRILVDIGGVNIGIISGREARDTMNEAFSGCI